MPKIMSIHFLPMYIFSSHPNDLVSCEFRPLDGKVRDKSTRERMIMFFLPLFPIRLTASLGSHHLLLTVKRTNTHAYIFFFLLKIHKVVVVHSPHSPYCIHTHFLSFYCQPFGIAVWRIWRPWSSILFSSPKKAIEIESHTNPQWWNITWQVLSKKHEQVMRQNKTRVSPYNIMIHPI